MDVMRMAIIQPMHPYVRYATGKQIEIVELIKRMAECESPSNSPADVNRFVDLVVEETSDIAAATAIRSEQYGSHLRLEFKLPGGKEKGQILGLGHSDTVWPLGTLNAMPVR